MWLKIKYCYSSGFFRQITKQSLLTGILVLFPVLTFASKTGKTIEAEKAELLNGASIIKDKGASGGQLVSLAESDQGLKLEKLPEAGTLAIRYASVNTGTISITVNNQQTVKVNVHSSGAVTGSFLHAIISIAIPKGAKLEIHLDSSDSWRTKTPAACVRSSRTDFWKAFYSYCKPRFGKSCNRCNSGKIIGRLK